MKKTEQCRWCHHMSEAVNYITPTVTIHVYILRQSHFNSGRNDR